MAAHYLTEVRELQPEGPYYLGGFCLGGQVAFEMAQRLRKDSQEVALLVAIDTYNFRGNRLRQSRRASFARATQKIQFHSLNMWRAGLRRQLTYLATKVQGVCSREVERLFVRLSNLLKMSPWGQGRSKSQVFLEHLNEEAHFDYVPEVFPGTLTIFKPRRNYSHLSDPHLGWNGLAAGGLDIIELPVNPGGIFVEPYVRTLAEKLRTLIDERHYGRAR
jgi:thioesterase domain-containing protein